MTLLHTVLFVFLRENQKCFHLTLFFKSHLLTSTWAFLNSSIHCPSTGHISVASLASSPKHLICAPMFPSMSTFLLLCDTFGQKIIDICTKLFIRINQSKVFGPSLQQIKGEEAVPDQVKSTHWPVEVSNSVCTLNYCELANTDIN